MSSESSVRYSPCATVFLLAKSRSSISCSLVSYGLKSNPSESTISLKTSDDRLLFVEIALSGMIHTYFSPVL